MKHKNLPVSMQRQPNSRHHDSTDTFQIGQMVVRHWKTALLVTIIGTLLFALGFSISDKLLTLRDESAEFDKIDSGLLNSLTLIEARNPFPDFLVVPPDGADSAFLSEKLPDGGLLVSLPSDYPWLQDELRVLVGALHIDGKIPGRDVVILTTGDRVSELVADLQLEGLRLPVHVDITDVLHTACQAPRNPIYFIIDDEFKLVHAGFLGASPKAYGRAFSYLAQTVTDDQ